MDKVQSKLKGWKGRLLSPGGQLILVRHVLQAMPIHMLASMSLPKAVLTNLERIFDKFVWGNSPENPRKVWRSWERLAYPVQENGLGVRQLKDILDVFPCKLWWKIVNSMGI